MTVGSIYTGEVIRHRRPGVLGLVGGFTLEGLEEIQYRSQLGAA